MPQEPTDPLSVSFSALKALHLVHRLNSFSAASERLGVNQSAISYTVEKLRRVFQDPLFVREGGRQVPTERCEEIVLATRQMLEGFLDLAAPQGFVPAEARRTVTIACNYYERHLLVPGIVAAIRAQAPKLRIDIVNSRAEGHLRLLTAEADVMIGPFAREEAGFYTRTLLRDDYVCMMDPGHPMAGRTLTLDMFLGLDLVDITYGGSWKSRYVEEIEQMGRRITPTLSLPSPSGVQRFLAGSSLVATLPRRLARRIGEGLHICDCPASGRFDVHLIWSARTHDAAMHKWLRNVIADSVRSDPDLQDPARSSVASPE